MVKPTTPPAGEDSAPKGVHEDEASVEQPAVVEQYLADHIASLEGEQPSGATQPRRTTRED